MATVMIDAGHGGFDNGATYNGRAEKNDTLNLALAVGNILANNGVNVLFTRTDDVYQNPNEKARIANASGADYFISIHRNSSPEPNMYSGVQTLVYSDEGIPGLFAQNINQELAKVGFTNLGTSVRKDLAVLRRTNMPAALVEAGFINTDQDNQIFDLKFPEVAQAIADGILQTINTVDGTVEATEEKEVYSVETGIFMHFENAEALARVMQENGYDCYIENQEPYYRVYHGVFQSSQEAEMARKRLFEDGFEAKVLCRKGSCDRRK